MIQMSETTWSAFREQAEKGASIAKLYRRVHCLAYYWVGLMTLYGLKKPSGQSSLEIDPPTTSINEGECAARDKMNIEVINEIQCLQQQDLTQIYPDLEMEESTKGF